MCSGHVFFGRTCPASFRSSCSCTGADGRSGPSIPMTAPCAISRSNPVVRCSASITGSRRNIRSPRLSRTCSRRSRSSNDGGLGADIDASAVAIAGDSAGANLALAAMIARKESGATPLAAAALFYGCYEPDFSTRSYASSGGGDFLLTTAACNGTGRIFLAARARTPPALRRLRAETCPDCRPSTCRRPASIPCATTRSHWQRGSPRRDRCFAAITFPESCMAALRMTRELDAARRMIAAGGRYVAHHFNDKRTGGIQPWNVANSSS